MKKTIALLVVLCIAASLFAIGAVKVGGTVEFITGKTNEFKEGDHTGTKADYKSFGFGFNVSGRFDVTGDISAWTSFGMTFCTDVKFRNDGGTEWISIKDFYDEAKKAVVDGVKVSKKTNAISVAAGVAVKPNLNAPVEVAIGGGLFFERLIGEVSVSGTVSGESINTTLGMSFINVGVSAYADLAAKINNNFGVGLTIMPRIGLMDFGKLYESDNSYTLEYKASGFAISFSMPVVVGVTYFF